MTWLDTRRLRLRQRKKATRQRQNKQVMVGIRGEDGLHHVQFVPVAGLETLRAMYGDKMEVFW